MSRLRRLLAWLFGMSEAPSEYKAGETNGDLQCWIDAVLALSRGEDVSVWECARGGRGRVL